MSIDTELKIREYFDLGPITKFEDEMREFQSKFAF